MRAAVLLLMVAAGLVLARRVRRDARSWAEWQDGTPEADEHEAGVPLTWWAGWWDQNTIPPQHAWRN